MKPAFESFLAGLQDTNRTLAGLVAWEKVKRSASEFEIELNTMNYLVGKVDWRHAVATLHEKNPETFRVIPLLIAVRGSLTYLKGSTLSTFDPKSLQSVIEALEDSGLSTIFADGTIKNIPDYFFGVGVGLDSNGRKNRGGILMEDAVTKMLEGCPKLTNIRRQVSASALGLTNCFGGDNKRFDFSAETSDTTYLFEVNFYNGAGSKLNETARSYKELFQGLELFKSKNAGLDRFQFVWITDGKGWLKAKNQLRETYNLHRHVYNLATFQAFLDKLPTN